MPAIVSVILGLVLLFFGRALYWAFVAVAGFLVGMMLADLWLAGQQEWVQVLAAIAAGLLGAIIGIFVQRLAFAIGGFYAGGYIALNLGAHLNLNNLDNPTLWFVVGGVIGAIVAAVVMDWAIIVLSSLAGAVAFMEPFRGVAPPLQTTWLVAVIMLAIVGIGVQGRRLQRPVVQPVEAPR